MKKVLLFVAVVGTIGMTSCKKDYTCECTYEILGETETHSFEIENAKKSDAEDACTYTVSGSSASCELK